ncbi:glycosyltransferase [Arenibaculum sp.]|jgi:glycosyltransferase involved in cell wall biosynthesis|uniref:glycosyltransferase n=1 Tax=Arenibaculum sp. TaxID=2865862 RepID=UPI002E11358C|nr:glycosyltransferase [Arenibaculum sp.]
MQAFAGPIAYVVTMVDGLETFVKREVETLADRGVQVDLYSIKNIRSHGFEPRSGIPVHSPRPVPLLKGVLLALATHLGETLKSLRLALACGAILEWLVALSWFDEIRRGRYRLLHASFGDRKLFVAYFLSRLTDTPLTVAIHAHEIYAQPNPKLFRIAMAHARSVVTISAKNRRLLVRDWAVAEEKVHLVRLPIDTEFWRPQNGPTVLTVARFTPRKGWNELVEAAARLPGFRFMAVGFGTLDVAALARDKGVADRFVVFPKLGPTQIRELMRFADIFCLPSKFTEDEGAEGIPVVLMEAMAMELPIVATDDGSICELVDAEIVRAADAEALAGALREVAGRVPRLTSLRYPRHREKVLRLHGPANSEALLAFFGDAAR